MILVIDANSFIAGFLRDSMSRRIIVSDKVKLFSPDWLEQEFNRNEYELMGKFPDKSKFSETRSILLGFVNMVPYNEYESNLNEASKLTKHEKDVPYFALALSLNCAIWSNEISFKSQSKIKVYSTSDLVQIFSL